ncbi:MAG: hypothetical protein M0006_05345 [Magnetospirillum sp.]|nr:hypothetical protein [Magnetospirillum sp.]
MTTTTESNTPPASGLSAGSNPGPGDQSMTTLNLNPETPSATIVNAANTAATVTDDKGRMIGIKRMNALDRLRMFEVIGGDNAKNEAFLGYATLAFHVVNVDGDAFSRPTTRRQLEAMIQMLDDDGLAAVAKGIAEHFAPAEIDADAVKNG